MSLLGIDSVIAPKALRIEAWDRLARDLDLQKLAAITSTIRLEDVIAAGRDILEGKVRGRIVVEIGVERRWRAPCEARNAFERTGLSHR